MTSHSSASEDDQNPPRLALALSERSAASKKGEIGKEVVWGGLREEGGPSPLLSLRLNSSVQGARVHHNESPVAEDLCFARHGF